MFIFFFSLNFICRCYIKLYDSPAKSTAEEDDDMSKLLPSQKKKMRQKQRKAEARAKKVLKCFSSLSDLLSLMVSILIFCFLLGGGKQK